MTDDFVELTTHRLRECEAWEAANPPESGVVSVVRQTHGVFWRQVETRALAVRAADAVVARVTGRTTLELGDRTW